MPISFDSKGPPIQGAGLGLRKEHFDLILSERPAVPWFEVISENFMIDGGRPRRVLEQIRRNYPVVMHGVSLSIGSAEPLNHRYLKRLRDLERWLEPALVSDHLCWGSIGGHNSHDLLPLPRTREALERVVRKVGQLQDALGRRVLLENISSYLEFQSSTFSEVDFLVEVAQRADCWLLLDVNNLYVNGRNHGLDPLSYLERLPVERIAQIHLAGHSDHGDVVIDTHDGAVRAEVWELYRQAIARFGSVPTLIEWDAQIPDFPVLLAEAERADREAASVLQCAAEARDVRQTA